MALSNDWSREVAALTPLIGNNTLELPGADVGALSSTQLLDRPTAVRGTHDFGQIPDQSVDAITGLDPLTGITDWTAEIAAWRRVLRQGGRLAFAVRGAGAAQGVIGLLRSLGGFDGLDVQPVTTDSTWLVQAKRDALAEVRYPFATWAPQVAALANTNDSVRSELYFQVGSLLLQTGDPQTARQCFSILEGLEPGSAESAFGLGMCEATLGEWAGALERLRRAAQIDPANAEISRWISVVEQQEQAATATASS